jgi:hypothetical protein
MDVVQYLGWQLMRLCASDFWSMMGTAAQHSRGARMAITDTSQYGIRSPSTASRSPWVVRVRKFEIKKFGGDNTTTTATTTATTTRQQHHQQQHQQQHDGDNTAL